MEVVRKHNAPEIPGDRTAPAHLPNCVFGILTHPAANYSAPESPRCHERRMPLLLEMDSHRLCMRKNGNHASIMSDGDPRRNAHLSSGLRVSVSA